MSSSRQPKPKTTKAKETTSKKKDLQVLAELGSTFANSRSMSRYHHSHKSKKQIPKILSKIQKNVQDLKKYCSDISPNAPRKNQDRYQPPGQSIRTVNDPAEESTASVEEIKKSYMSVYGKQTQNIVELWKFYNSFFSKSRIGKTSITSHSASIPARSELLPDYSLESRNDSGRGSVLGSIDRIPLENINISDLLSNRPSDRRSKAEKLQKVVQESEQSRPLQKIATNKKLTVKNVQFNLRAELDLVLPFNQQKDTPKFQMEFANRKKQLIEYQKQCQTISKNMHWSFSQLEKETNNISKIATTVTLQTINTENNLQKQVIEVVEIVLEQESNPKLINIDEDKDFFKKIFQKNMLINRRKQQLNSKLKKEKGQDQPNKLDAPMEGLDEAIIIEEDRPHFLQDQLPLSKQDISLLQKLDQLDKQAVPTSKSESENRLHEALKGLKKKKKFEDSKFSVPEIPFKKMAKKPQILDIPFDQNQQTFLIKKKVSPTKQQQRQLSNSSLLDCIIDAAQGQDSFLRNCEQNYEKIQSQGFSPLDPIDL